MTSIVRIVAVAVIAAAMSLPAAAEEKTPAAPAVHVKTSDTTTARQVSWPGYYYYGVYYGSYRWRYQPYYTLYANPWYDYGYHYAPYSYAGPGYGYGYYYAPYSFTWPHYGAYGYTYYGPVLTSGYYAPY
jgi:hypothetical protein